MAAAAGSTRGAAAPTALDPVAGPCVPNLMMDLSVLHSLRQRHSCFLRRAFSALALASASLRTSQSPASRASRASFVITFVMLLARWAYLKVFTDSSQSKSKGDTHAIITVLLLPPRASLNILVSLLSL